MLNAEELLEHFKKYEERYGDDAIVATLRWLRTAEHCEDPAAEIIVPAFEQLLVRRAVQVFEAHWLGEESPASAYRRANDEARRLLVQAKAQEIMAADTGEV